MNVKYIANSFPQNETAACSGVEGSNAQAATKKFFPGGEIIYLNSFAEVFEAVKNDVCKYGVLPIENSFNGSVRDVYKLLTTHKFFIVKSLLIPIRHSLLANKGATLESITEIYSHPQALGQCSKFLAGLNAKQIPFWNTAGAAKMISESEKNNIAAIASPICAELYGLEEIASDIQDNSENYTKFICISKEPAIYPDANHISLVVGCENVPGALNDVLSKIAAHGVNMNKLESCPKEGRKFEYIFFLEIEASLKDDGIISMLEDVKKSCPDFEFLGNYNLS